MEKPLVVRDSKIILVISVVCTVFFSFCLMLSAVSYLEKRDGESLIFCVAFFGGFALCSLMLLIYAVRRKLVFYENVITYTPPFGRIRSFSYSQIGAVVQKYEKFIIYGFDGTKLAVFENNMPAFYDALNILSEKYVKIVPRDLAVSAAPGTSYDAVPGRAADTAFVRKITDWNRNLDLTDKNAYLRSRYSSKAIRKEKEAIRLFGIILIIVSLTAIFFPDERKMTVNIFILLSHYLLFLFFYPKLTLEKGKRCDEYHITFPMAAFFISLLFSMNFIASVNMEERQWFAASAVLFFILFVPILLMLRFRRIREHPFVLLMLAIVLFFLSFYMLPAAGYVASYQPVHDTVIVLDKGSHRGSHTTSYSIVVNWREREQKMSVSSGLYESVEAGDRVRVCIRKSLLGMELWRVHH